MDGVPWNYRANGRIRSLPPSSRPSNITFLEIRSCAPTPVNNHNCASTILVGECLHNVCNTLASCIGGQGVLENGLLRDGSRHQTSDNVSDDDPPHTSIKLDQNRQPSQSNAVDHLLKNVTNIQPHSQGSGTRSSRRSKRRITLTPSPRSVVPATLSRSHASAPMSSDLTLSVSGSASWWTRPKPVDASHRFPHCCFFETEPSRPASTGPSTSRPRDTESNSGRNHDCGKGRPGP